MAMDVSAYLSRIGYHGSAEPTVETLNALHRAHMLAVPFENLNIPLKRPILLDEAWLFDKIVKQKRGGFCYELNGLFGALLREMGYDVQMLSARVMGANGEFGIEFDHMALMVRLEELWLADVGFGDSFLEPLRFAEPGEQWREGIAYRVQMGGDERLLMKVEAAEELPQYTFTLKSRQLADFLPGCHYHQTSPDSPFPRRRICSRALPQGRVTLSDMKLIVTTDGTRHESQLASEAEYRSALFDYFGVTL